MKISYNWLQTLINLSETPENIGKMLTGTGLEVESIEPYTSIPGGLDGIVVGEVKTCQKHPNADKLSVTTVSIGLDQDLQIVCGAPNVSAGQKVLVATVGSTVYPLQGEPFKINKSKIRGEVSEGMICAEDELSLGKSHDGILVLPPESIPGTPAAQLYEVYRDFTIEIGLTANRGDAASHMGVARDLRALTGKAIQLPDHTITIPQNECLISVNVQSEACIRYSGLAIKGITVKPSPAWLQNRLKTIGLSPINNVVDATNYVMHELGQPLHAFDTKHIKDQTILVKTALAGTTITTLDNIERKLTGSELLICDAIKPLAIAGVFGGAESGIQQDTSTIFIESAFFQAASIRKTAKLHGLSTDASFRYERGTDPEITVTALLRASKLILEIAGGSIDGGLVDWYPNPVKPVICNCSLSRLNQLIGQDIPVQQVKSILNGLDITILSESSEMLELQIPAYRSDVTREADIVEEVLRIYGLNNIAIPTQVKSSISPSDDENGYLMRNRVADYLSANGFYELTCNSLTKSAYYSQEETSTAVKVLNPLSNDLDIMRMDMLFSGLEMIQYNHNRKQQDIRAFEYGFTYQNIDGTYEETPHISIFLTGNKTGESWIQAVQPASYFTLKSYVNQLLSKLGLTGTTANYLEQSGRLYNVMEIHKGKTLIATIGTVQPELCKQFDITMPVYTADILWNNVLGLLKGSRITYKPVSAYPAVRRDLALVLDQHISYADVEKIAVKHEPRLLKDINTFDVYQGEKVATGKKSYAVSFILQDDEKTLTDQEIDAVVNGLLKRFEKELGATLRS